MRALVMMSLWLLAACTTQAVRCDRHLTPINVPQPVTGDSKITPKSARESTPASKTGGGSMSPSTERIGAPSAAETPRPPGSSAPPPSLETSP